MFCPGCGSEERQASQYCRACGSDLRVVRMSIERPDSITASAVTAREEIGRAVADKIRQLEDASDLKKVAEDVLPQIEKFLESYEEKRLRRVRAGVIVGASGLGGSILGLLMAAFSNVPDADGGWIVLGLGLTAFTIGLALMLNGLLFTKPRTGIEDHSADARLQGLLDGGQTAPQLKSSGEGQPLFRSQTTSNLSNAPGASITEHTTHHLKTER
jgi:hypothetical protein